jgi:hypothetical protein
MGGHKRLLRMEEGNGSVENRQEKNRECQKQEVSRPAHRHA